MSDSLEFVANERFIEEQADAVSHYKTLIHVPGSDAKITPLREAQIAAMMATTEKQLTTNEALNTTTAFGSNYTKVILGMVRDTALRQFGLDFVNVQPLSVPSGTIYYLDITRDDGTKDSVRPNQDHSTLDGTAYDAMKNYSVHTAGEGGDIAKGMNLAISQSTVTLSATRKLKVSASFEMQMDLAATHNLSAMDILRGAAVDQIAREKDAEIVAAVRAAAIANGTVTFGAAPSGYLLHEWEKKLGEAIFRAHEHIVYKSDRNPGVLICGLRAYSQLQALHSFRPAVDTSFSSTNFGVVPTGSLNGQYQVYWSRYLQPNEMILGMRGGGFLDSGITLASYLPLFISERVFDVNKQRWDQSFARREQLFTTGSNLYARIVIDDTATGISDPA